MAKKYFCSSSLTLTIQKVTDFIHVDFKIWNLLAKTEKKGFNPYKIFVVVFKHKQRE